MEYFQKKGKEEIKIKFAKDHLIYFVMDTKSKGEFAIPYDRITNNKFELIESNDGYKNYAIYLLVVGLILLIGGIGAFLLIGSAIMYALYRRSVIKFTVIETAEKRLYIMHDNKHDDIIKEIYKHRSEYMKNKYAFINHANPPGYELRKFQWLLNEKVLTQDEFNEYKFQLMKKDEKILN